jgi:prevent-host-death family protein
MRATTAFLKSHLSEVLERVIAGETVVVTRRGRVIAHVVPATPAEGNVDQRLGELEARGVVRRGRQPLPQGFWSRPRPQDPEGAIVAGLVEEREEGW